MSAGGALARALRTPVTLLAAARALGPRAVLPRRWGERLGAEGSDAEHLDAALAWLAAAQDACGGRGVSAMYTLGSGWAPPYPETSGYIAATFLAGARALDRPELAARAIRIGDWELDILTPSGGVLSAVARAETRVFNTGQVILGLCALEEQLGQGRHLEGAARAGRYLLSLQEADGSWERDTYCGARAYHARVDWGLLRLAALTGDRRFAAAAARNVAWVLRQATPNGWFARCGFHEEPPVTHVLGYTLRGLLECHALAAPELAGEDLLGPVFAAADALVRVVEARRACEVPGLLPASFLSDWSSRDGYSCLTGNAQLSIVFARLAQMTGRADYAATARTLLSGAKRAQRLRVRAPGVRGALAGSHPVAGPYAGYAFPNWATKFLADALLLQLNAGDRGFRVEA